MRFLYLELQSRAHDMRVDAFCRTSPNSTESMEQI